MAGSDGQSEAEMAERVIQSIKEAENSALAAVHKFVDTVNDAIPDVGGEDGRRKNVIDSAFKMTEQLVGTWTDMARHLVKVSQDALDESGKQTKA